MHLVIFTTDRFRSHWGSCCDEILRNKIIKRQVTRMTESRIIVQLRSGRKTQIYEVIKSDERRSLGEDSHGIFTVSLGASFYRPHPKDDGRLYFHFVCQFTREGGILPSRWWGGTYSALNGGGTYLPRSGLGGYLLSGLAGGGGVLTQVWMGGVPTLAGGRGTYLVGTPPPRVDTPHLG